MYIVQNIIVKTGTGNDLKHQPDILLFAPGEEGNNPTCLPSESVVITSSDKDLFPGSNIIISGIDIHSLSLLDHFALGDVEMEAVLLKPAQDGPAGVVCRVVRGGRVSAGDKVVHTPRRMKIHVVTLSDRAYSGFYEDKSGRDIIAIIKNHFSHTKRICDPDYSLLPDKADDLRSLVKKLSKECTDIIITTGGTGVGERDITPDTLIPMFDKEIPGIMDYIRVTCGGKNPNALISRSVAGIIGHCQIYALPGSRKAVVEYMTEILKVMEHVFFMLHGIDNH